MRKRRTRTRTRRWEAQQANKRDCQAHLLLDLAPGHITTSAPHQKDRCSHGCELCIVLSLWQLKLQFVTCKQDQDSWLPVKDSSVHPRYYVWMPEHPAVLCMNERMICVRDEVYGKRQGCCDATNSSVTPHHQQLQWILMWQGRQSCTVIEGYINLRAFISRWCSHAAIWDPRGVQEQHVGSIMKHFFCYGQGHTWNEAHDSLRSFDSIALLHC